MANLTSANSTYSAGPIDTFTAVSDVTSEVLAQHINGGLSAIIAIEGDLGIGANLKRSRASLVDRLDTILDVNGAIQNGTAFPTSPTPVMGQLFNRTDLKQLHIYDSALAQWQRIDSTNVHGSLSGLLTDDHTIYLLADGTREATGNLDTTQNLRFKSGTGNQMTLDHAATAARTITIPDATGSLVLSGSIVDADIGASAAIVDAKLAAITDRSKIPAALAYEDEANIFTQDQVVEKTRGGIRVRSASNAAQLGLQEGTDLGRVQLTSNATFDGTNWNRDDTTKPAWVLSIGGATNNNLSLVEAPAGANPITFTTRWVVDSTGKLTTGTVPLARLSAADANAGYPQSGTGGETLRVLRGTVNSAGTILRGTGFTITKGGTGLYTINYTTSFGAAASVAVSASPQAAACPSSEATNNVSIDTFDLSTGLLADKAFSFVAMGPA